MLFFSLDRDDENEKDELQFLTNYVILDDFDFALVGMGIKRKKMCRWKDVDNRHGLKLVVKFLIYR